MKNLSHFINSIWEDACRCKRWQFCFNIHPMRSNICMRANNYFYVQLRFQQGSLQNCLKIDFLLLFGEVGMNFSIAKPEDFTWTSIVSLRNFKYDACVTVRHKMRFSETILSLWQCLDSSKSNRTRKKILGLCMKMWHYNLRPWLNIDKVIVTRFYFAKLL